jgi:hypothetical protein
MFCLLDTHDRSYGKGNISSNRSRFETLSPWRPMQMAAEGGESAKA